jgi:hypothetical protein
MRRKSISGLFSGLKRNSVKDTESEETDSGKKTPKTPSSGKKNLKIQNRKSIRR